MDSSLCLLIILTAKIDPKKDTKIKTVSIEDRISFENPILTSFNPKVEVIGASPILLVRIKKIKHLKFLFVQNPLTYEITYIKLYA
jgi:hypothetical protein